METYDYEDFGDLSGAAWPEPPSPGLQSVDEVPPPPGYGSRVRAPLPPPPEGVQVSMATETYDADDYADLGGAAAAPGWSETESVGSASGGDAAALDEAEALLRSIKANAAKKK